MYRNCPDLIRLILNDNIFFHLHAATTHIFIVLKFKFLCQCINICTQKYTIRLSARVCWLGSEAWTGAAGRRSAAGFLAVPAHSCFLPASDSYRSVFPLPGRHLKLGRTERRTWRFWTERCTPCKIQEFHRPISLQNSWDDRILESCKEHLTWTGNDRQLNEFVESKLFLPACHICANHIKSFTNPANKFVSGDPQTVNPLLLIFSSSWSKVRSVSFASEHCEQWLHKFAIIGFLSFPWELLCNLQRLCALVISYAGAFIICLPIQ